MIWATWRWSRLAGGNCRRPVGWPTTWRWHGWLRFRVRSSRWDGGWPRGPGAQKAGDDEANWGFSLIGLTSAQASIADQQLKHLEAYNLARRTNALQMIDGLTGLSGITLPGPQQARIDFDGAFYLRLPLLFDDPQRCMAVHDALHAQGIGAGRMYKKTLPDLFPTLHGHFPGADAVASGLLTLPTHHHLRPDDVAAIIETVTRASS